MPITVDDVSRIDGLRNHYQGMRREIARVIVGQDAVVEELMIALFAGGHVLLEGVPGLAKTLLISSVARVLDLSFNRIQFTPDLMPSDITGSEILEEDHGTGQRRFRFIRGPIFADLILADEINRTPPKTQAALLQAMQEREVTAGGKTYQLEQPFFVLATQNPIEQEGTYPLPEAQKDRFLLNTFIGYPSTTEEEQIVERTTSNAIPAIEPVCDREAVLAFQKVVRAIPVSRHVTGYAVDLVRATRPSEDNPRAFIREQVAWGAGPRASQALIMCAKCRAALDGRINVSCNDVRQLALPVLRHRLAPSFVAEAEGIRSDDIIKRLLQEVQERADA